MPGIEIKGRSKRANYRHGRLVEPKESVDRRKGQPRSKLQNERPPQRKLKFLQPRIKMDSIK